MRPHRILAALTLAAALAGCRDHALAPDAARAPDAPAEAAAGPLQTGFILRDGKPWKVRYEVRGGRAVFEGDIDLGPAEEIARTEEELLRRVRPESGPDGPRQGVVTSSTSRRWGGGGVPFVIEATVPNQWRITGAMDHIEQSVAGVDFTPRQSYHSSWIIFRRTTDPNICGQSPVGRQGGGQIVLINDSCGTDTAIHEILHSLGFWHEQSRCDRDTFVEIVWANVMTGYASNFDKYCSGANTVYAYDETSIMHYHRWAFSKNGLPTIRSRRGLDHLIGTGTVLSTQDVHTINWMYQPYAPRNLTATYPGGVPTLSWSPVTGAQSYTVLLLVKYEENDYEWGYSTYEYSEYLGTTSGTTFQDGGRSYTGVSACSIYSGTYGYADDWYYYDVYANLPNGITSRVARVYAEVATC